ncbi:MAG: tripartite tricarboxylate transporter substrate binding protein [Burkholderiales bacterium]|nr:tripartite tricarboxylate transporter substrate binding protein [Burkholderiales bacterium]
MSWRPGRDIELVAGTPAGGGQDRPARALLQVLAAERLIDVPARLVNIPGRGGGNAWDHLARHRGDPHVAAISSPTLITNRQLGVSGFDDTALTPLATLYTEYIAFLVRADSAIADAAGLLARLRDPATLTIAMATARGNTNHMALAQLVRHAGADPRALELHVFDSARHAVADLLDGKAEAAAITAVSAAPELAAGRLRALAVSAPRRLGDLYAGTPAWRELGVDCVIGTWRGVIGAAGLDTAQVAWWEAALGRAAKSAAWREELRRQYWVDTWAGSAATRDLLERERGMLGELISGLGLRS